MKDGYELAFEEHRYFDARRWLIAETVFSGPAKAIEIYGKLNPDTLLYTHNVLTTGVEAGSSRESTISSQLWPKRSAGTSK